VLKSDDLRTACVVVLAAHQTLRDNVAAESYAAR
jgi:hypothetical protein